MMRNLIRTCNQITSEALEEEDDANVILDHAEQMIFALAEHRSGRRVLTRGSRWPKEFLQRLKNTQNVNRTH